MERSVDPTLAEEQQAFEEQLGQLLRTHAGKWVLFKKGKPVEFFDEKKAAYKAGLQRFGIDTPFLVVCVEKAEPQPVSITWDVGLMFE